MCFADGTTSHYWAVHKPGTPGARLRELVDIFGNIVQFFILFSILLLRSFRRRPNPVTVGLSSAQEEKAITPQRRCKPVHIIPNHSWKDFRAFLRNPTHEEIRAWMHKGEMATWPHVRALHVRMDIEVELHSKSIGLLLGRKRRLHADDVQRSTEAIRRTSQGGPWPIFAVA